MTLLVRSGDRLLALPLTKVLEVFRMVAIALHAPRAPRYCMGVVDWHGRLLPVFDLGARLQLTSPRDASALIDGHVVVVQDPSGAVGYAVDEVCELTESPIEPLDARASAMLGRLTTGAVLAANGRRAPLIDSNVLLTVIARRDLRAALQALSDGEDRA